MKLSLKLPLAIASALVLVLAAALFGIWSLNQALNTYATVVKEVNDHERTASDLAVAFKSEVQEWKNTLVRGKNPKDLDKHWSAFNNIGRDIADKSKKLVAALPAGESRSMVEKFSAAHAAMGQNYQKGYEAFKAAGFDPAAGDAAVQGMDREPANLLDEVGNKLEAVSATVAAQAASDGRRATTLSLILMLIVSGAGIGAGLWVSRSITRPIGAAVKAAERIAANDLSVDVHVEGRDETAQLLRAMASMTNNLRQVVGDVRTGVDSVSTASGQIAAGNQDLSSRTEEQASSLQQTAASMEQLTSTVKQSADNAKQANQLASSASEAATKGGAVVGQVVATMNDITASSKKIADIISVIDGIAFQTNILALNAAVEAARAGEQGRGFAVVTTEVRTLAQRSAAAAREIKTLIGDSVDKVDDGTKLVDEAGRTMAEIVAAVKRVTDIIAEISTASQEQRSGIEQVNQAVTQMDQTTQQNAALVEQSAAASSSLSEQTHTLARAVAVFKLGHDESRHAIA